MAFLIWNVRGFNSDKIHAELKDLICSKAIEIFSVLETKIKPHRTQAIRDAFWKEWDSHCNIIQSDPPSPDSIWTFWRKDVWKVDIITTHPQPIHMKLTPWI